ncbi:MAG: YhdP family protein [Xanthomonadales bacterium]|jgi:uncharacterized protein (TIGR02099 family)|nr:YhdP family protein [Xanthomonadales bacterium]
MRSLKTIFRRARTLLWTAFSIVVILLAVGVGLGRLLMPYSVHYQPQLEHWLSEEFGQPVAIESFEGSWTAFGPRLTLRGLHLLENAGLPGEGAAEVVIESAALDIRPLGYLLAGGPLYNFRVIGADFELSRDESGEFTLSGFGVSNRGGSQGSALKDLARVGEVVLQDSSLDYIDEKLGIHLGLAGINGRLNLEGKDLATQVRAELFDPRSGLVYGEIDGTAVLRLDDEQVVQRAEWQATAGELMLASFQGKVPASPFMPLTGWLDAEVWGVWTRGDGHRINGMTALRDALLVNEYQDIHLERVNSNFRWRFSDGGQWSVHLADFFFDDGTSSWTTPRLSVARDTSDDTGLWISADSLPLGVPLNLARDIMSVYGKPWPTGLPAAADGQVSELDLVLSNEWHLALARGQIRDASVVGWERWPDVTGLDGKIELTDAYGLVDIRGDGVRIDWPRMFRDPLELDVSDCRLEMQWGDTWQAGFERCGVANADLAVHGDLLISGNEGKPAIDANFAVTRGRVGRLGPYFPEAVMSENVLGWLRRGLLGGEIRLGRFQIHGDLDDWPFRNGEGRFGAVVWLDAPRVDYLEGWPVVQGGDIVARFIGAGMDVRGTVADTGGVGVDEVVVTIEDMKAPLLEIEYRTPGSLPGLLGFLQQTPLREQINVDLSRFEFAGPADIDGRIVIPLGQLAGELDIDGTVQVNGGRFTEPERDITIDDIRGKLTYSERGFEGRALQAQGPGGPALLDLSADADELEKFRAELSGHFDINDVLIDERLRQDLPMLNQIQGRSDWLVSLVVAPDGQAGGNAVTLVIRSGLEGVTIALPAPLNKAAEETWPLLLEYPIANPERPLDIVIENRAALRFDLPGENVAPERVVIDLGGRLGPLPAKGMLRIGGSAPMLDLDGWVAVIVDEMGRGAEMGGLELEEGRLQADEILFLDRLLQQVEMTFSVSGDEFNAGFASRDIEGAVRFSSTGPGLNSLSAEFERLVLGEPESGGLSMETDPKDLPALHLYARSLSYLGIEMGETRIEAYPDATGFHFEKVDAASDALSVQASGDWSLTGDGHRSDFKINMVSESLGDFLQSLDISSSVQGGQTLVSFDAWWPGTPGNFALSRLNGQVDFSVIQGNITGASAGPGRLLGLVSFTALPKRLSLDFRDVFESGFSFDEATGTFALENGIASTDDVLLTSSAASINVSGRTDLVQQQYDQLMTIRPGVGNTLPIIGALTAGPVGVAAGLALQGLLHEELAEATKVRYTISGSWDEPIIEPVEVERAGAKE